jgi:hypothetical protein
MNKVIEEIIDGLVLRAVFADTDAEAECLIEIIKAIRAWQGEIS